MHRTTLLFVLPVLGSPLASTPTGGQCPKPSGNANTNPSGPLLNTGFADPCIIEVDNVYYAFATNHGSHGHEINVPAARSNSLNEGWEILNNANVLPDPGNWTTTSTDKSPRVWDPDVRMFNSTHFVMYYTASVPVTPGRGEQQKHCIGAAHASSILGPYHPQNHTLVCPPEGTIASSFYHHNETNYLLFKAGGHHDETKTAHIDVVKLSDEGLKTIGNPINLLNSTHNEYDTEGPSISTPDGKTFFLWFVTGYFQNASYAIHYLPGPSPTGPFHNHEPKALFETGTYNGVYLLSPSGPDFLNHTHMTFMTTRPNANCDPDNPLIRTMRTAVLTYNSLTVTAKPSQ